MARDDQHLEKPLFRQGTDPDSASRALYGLLSDDDLDSNIVGFSPEDSEADDDAEAPPVESEQDEREEDLDDESEGSLEEWDAEEEAEEDESEEPELYTVKVDGEERQVTLDELLNGYSFQAHNTRKSQQLAEERKALESETAAIRESRQRYAEGLERLEQALKSQAPEEPDWDKLERESPQQLAIEHAKWQRHQQQREALEAERRRVQEEQTDEYRQALLAYRQSEAERLLEVVPEWKDGDSMKKGTAELASYARDMGFSDDEIAQVMDHRAIVMMRKAMLYDRLQKKGSAVRSGKKAQTLKPGTQRAGNKKSAPKRVQQARRRVRQSGRMADATDFLRDVLPDDI